MNSVQRLSVIAFLFSAVEILLSVLRRSIPGLVFALLLGIIALYFSIQSVKAAPSFLTRAALIVSVLGLAVFAVGTVLFFVFPV